MNQPFAVITLTNTSGRTCTLNGYPTVTAAWTSQGLRPVSVLDGGIYEVPDPKRSRFWLAPGGHAWFAAGTMTNFESSPVVTFTRLAVATDDHTDLGNSLSVKVELGSSRQQGKPDAIIVTAFAPGKRPHS